ncbi:helix-turn-helix domain-containing protein [Aliicoccus persicus]|uniref:Cro/C1-type HTH DNA-binding domain-containing protein n=1 Tax=Aliicoccus persicus TaxID=930138 RepID=A0A662Z384_9STAP|nr:helix-turn-helix transcriptional regulator [Aliicoccus persicus]SEW01802.1 Cro/C1-type HTH DNA-binding domain-containing protein [Aliicoccus persicus]
MTNTSLLLAKMAQHGYNKTQLADKVGIHRHTFSNKMNNQSHFTVEEVVDLAETLELTATEIDIIFFDNQLAKINQTVLSKRPDYTSL